MAVILVNQGASALAAPICGVADTYLAEFGELTDGSLDLDQPRGIGVDRGNDRMQVFDPDGSFLAAYGSSGDGPGEFDSPCRVEINAAGRALVLDSGNARVQVFRD